MSLTRSQIWRLVLFAATITCAILARINAGQRLLFQIAGGILVFAITALWLMANHRDHSA